MAKSYDLYLQKSFIVDVWKLLNTPTYVHYRAILISMSHSLKDDFEDFFIRKNDFVWVQEILEGYQSNCIL